MQMTTRQHLIIDTFVRRLPARMAIRRRQRRQARARGLTASAARRRSAL